MSLGKADEGGVGGLSVKQTAKCSGIDDRRRRDLWIYGLSAESRWGQSGPKQDGNAMIFSFSDQDRSKMVML